ncbi:MAG: hypothetical protein EP330_08100 [Deltaproteobacteria bacterium]|nr:MAG: hypothetical protein EP330_08100 [Deltaproteobacteria bacterium]
MKRTVLASVGLLGAGITWLSYADPATALPLYAQRSGRTCANCHISPTWEDSDGWENPELSKRKCTLSCASCHVDPTGGGMRNVSGRYYGQSTLSMIHTQARSYSDNDRELLGNDLLYNVQQWFDQPERNEEGRFVPSDRAEVDAGVGAGQTGRWTAHGKLRKVTEMQFWDGRYADLNADPVFSFGGDFRGAYYTGTGTLFPMQMELHTSIHPTHHVSVVATVAGRGRATGGLDPLPIFPRRAFVLLHELPYFSWAKAGIFMPSFGTYIDDHTAYVRDLYELDTSKGQDTVLGVELGTAPNYPFATVSVFANDTSMVTGAAADADEGWGMSAQAGYRDLWWSLYGHAQMRQRPEGAARGDLVAAGVGWALNPATIWQPVAVTWTGELDVGQHTDANGKQTSIAALSEVAWMPVNGWIVRYRTDVAERSGLSVKHGLGLGVSVIPGLTTDGWFRVASSNGVTSNDVLVMNHVWF